jgi:Flp pilus assembly pilin Flp
MGKLFQGLVGDCHGAVSAEYAMIVGIVGAAIALGAIILGDQIAAAMSAIAGKMN